MSLPFVVGQGPKVTEKIIRLDPIQVFLIFFAVASFILVIVLTNTPIVIFGPSTDVGTIAANYLLIGSPVAAFAPLLVGNHLYDLRQLGAILRPVTWGKGLRKNRFPDVAILGVVSGLGAITLLDYALTFGGFSPTLSFWATTTNKIVYADGGIFEEFIFRTVFYGAVNRFPGSRKYLLDNPFGFFVVAAPINTAVFVEYHLKVYANSTKALTMVAGECYIINSTFRLIKYAGWVVTVIHAVLNFTAAP